MRLTGINVALDATSETLAEARAALGGTLACTGVHVALERALTLLRGGAWDAEALEGEEMLGRSEACSHGDRPCWTSAVEPMSDGGGDDGGDGDGDESGGGGGGGV